MKSLTKLTVGLMMLVTLTTFANAEPPVEKSPYAIRFGLIKMRSDKTHYISRETDAIPLKVGEHVLKFGYEITTTAKTPYTLHYVLHLPHPPKVISDELAKSNPSAPTTTVVSPKREIWDKSFIDYLWFDEGDPDGPHSIDIFANDTLIKTVLFKVKAD